jgi:hypothetical protein
VVKEMGGPQASLADGAAVLLLIPQLEVQGWAELGSRFASSSEVRERVFLQLVRLYLATL